jgi:hypothetical protein
MIEQIIAKLESDAERYERQILSAGFKDYTEYRVNCAIADTIRRVAGMIRDSQHIEEDED